MAASTSALAGPAVGALHPITIKDLTDLMDEMEAWCCALREILLSLPPSFVVATAKSSKGVLLFDGGTIRQIKGCPPPLLPNCKRKAIRSPAPRRRPAA
jgi:hypothetical protein